MDAFIPIDNEYVLYNLLSTEFGIQRQTLLGSANVCLKGKALIAFEAAMIVASQGHAPAFSAVQGPLVEWLETLIPDPVRAAVVSTAILQFLQPRAHSQWLADQLGHIS